MHTVLVWVSDMNIEEAIKQLEGCPKTELDLSRSTKLVYENGEIYLWSYMKGKKDLEGLPTYIINDTEVQLPNLIVKALTNKEDTLKHNIIDLEKAAQNFQDFLDTYENDGVTESDLGDKFHQMCTPELILELIRVYKEPKYYPATA